MVRPWHAGRLQEDRLQARKDGLTRKYPELAETLGEMRGLAPAEAAHQAARAKLDVQLAMLAADTAIEAASAADRQAGRLVLATWVLAAATVALVVATGILIYVTAYAT